MAALALKGSLRGPSFTAAGLPGCQNPPPHSRFRDHRSSAVSLAWKVAKCVLQNDTYLYDAQALHIDTHFTDSASYIDLLNRPRHRDRAVLLMHLSKSIYTLERADTLGAAFMDTLLSPLETELANPTDISQLGRTKLEATDQHKRRQEAREKRSRDLVDGLIEYISSDSENYKYVIIASKENANMIMEEGFISSGARDEILDDLERIEKDIKDENFQWGNNKDIRTDIIEALIDIVEGPAKRLDAVISHYDQMLTVLNLWCNDSTDKFVTQIKELQVELVLLAIRNEGLVVPCDNRNAGCILLGDMVLSKVEQLENDVSRLVSYKNKMDSTGSTDGSMNSLSNGGLHHVHNSIMDFGNLIVGDIAHDLIELEKDLLTQKHLLTPNDEVTKSVHLMWRHKIELELFQGRGYSGSIYNAAADSSKRFLRAYELVPVMIKAAKEFARNSFFDHEKFLGFLASGYIGGPELAGFRASKELERLYGGEAVVKQDFKSHSDDTVGKLLELLRRLFQSEQKK